MSHISGHDPRINPPVDTYAFNDKVSLWVRQPLTPAQQREHGAHDTTPRDRVRRFRLAFGQQIQIPQPTIATIEWLGNRNDVHLNYVEEGLEWVYDDAEPKDEGFWWLHRHVVKRHHRDQGVRVVFEGETRYTGPRTAPTLLTVYRDKPCRVAGVHHGFPCVHLEWRIRGAAALRRAGIHSVLDLLTLDRRRFWQQRLLLFGVDTDRLGRRYHNWTMGTRRRQPWVQRYGAIEYDHDKRAGHTIIRALGSVQEVIDAYRSRFDVHSCLIPMANDAFLPLSLL